MAEVTVREENRPSFGKYVVYTAIGVLLVNGFIAVLTQNSGNPVVALGGVLLTGIGSIAIVFLMVQSLVEEWFAAAEIIDE